MLELTSLLLSPWEPHGPSPRRILDADRGDLVGTARWRESTTPWWKRLISRPILEIREAGDEPLLFTLRRLWSWRVVWQAREADGHRVGLITKHEVRNRAERRLALLQVMPGGEELYMRGLLGSPLASLQKTAQGDLLKFDEMVENNPFAKMVLLGAALIRGWV
jgi:hypothetical protein